MVIGTKVYEGKNGASYTTCFVAIKLLLRRSRQILAFFCLSFGLFCPKFFSNACNIIVKTIFLLFGSNLFMTFAWYGQLKFRWLESRPLIVAILISWSIAFFEYCLMVPANRIGYRSGEFTGYQLKVIQEAITLVVFVGFASLVLKEKMTWNYAVSFLLMGLAVYFAMGFKAGNAS
jgi:uncharacterized protein (DUF486 family)